MTPVNTLFALLALITLAVHSLPSANADLVVTEDLGVLKAGSSTAFNGNTATGANNCDTYTAARGIVTWGNEIVFQFTVRQTACIQVTSVALGGDPDLFLLNSLETEVNAAGLIDATGALAFAFLDEAVPQSEKIAIVEPGTYYLSVDSFGEADAVFFCNLTVNDVILPVASSIGVIAEVETPFTIDTIGNTIDTEIAVFNDAGSLLALSDDADLTGDGFIDVLQSRMDFIGLPAGNYYLAVGAWDTVWGNCLGADGSGGTEGGLLNINHGPTPALILDGEEPVPAVNSIQGTLEVGGILWYSFEIGKAIPPEPLRITNITRNAEGQVNITFNSVAGREYAVEISSDIIEWQELTDGLVGEAESTTYTHTSPDRAARYLYYRIRQLGAIPLE
ncbi:MAG: hypothetical protein VCA55_05840 [Verrucomicrobiales bacterium]